MQFIGTSLASQLVQNLSQGPAASLNPITEIANSQQQDFQSELGNDRGNNNNNGNNNSDNNNINKDDKKVKPVTKHELWGWFSYSWASEPFIVGAVGTYIPILLEEFARRNAVRADDYSIPCDAPIFIHPNSTSLASFSVGFIANNSTNSTIPKLPGPLPPGDITNPAKDIQCVIPLFHYFYINTSSFALYTFAFSVLIQSLVVISMSSAADRGKFRKKLLVWFAVAGAVSTCSFLAVSQQNYLICAILAIVSNSSFGAAAVCGNSFLPGLVRNSPEMLSVVEKIKKMAADAVESVTGEGNGNGASSGSGSENGDGNGKKGKDDSTKNKTKDSYSIFKTNREPTETDRLLPHGSHSADRDADDSLLFSVFTKVSNRLSGKGTTLGYIAALLVQLITVYIIKSTGSTTWSLQCAIFTIGFWWLTFQVPVAAFLKPRHGPSLLPALQLKLKLKFPETDTRLGKALKVLVTTMNGGYTYIFDGWATVWTTLKEASKLKDASLFLVSWFFISDAVSTINFAAVLFAKTELQMDPLALAAVGAVVVLFGILGAIWMPKYVLPRLGANNPVRGIVFVVLLASFIPLYGIAGFYTNRVGLKYEWEMYLLAAWYGFVLGSLNTLGRSVFLVLVPTGRETVFFALYSIADKGSSMFGPFVTGLITDKTHNIRYTFYFLYVLMMMPVGLLCLVDIERGRKEASRYGQAGFFERLWHGWV